jgi:hypothetical protein
VGRGFGEAGYSEVDQSREGNADFPFGFEMTGC